MSFFFENPFVGKRTAPITTPSSNSRTRRSAEIIVGQDSTLDGSYWASAKNEYNAGANSKLAPSPSSRPIKRGRSRGRKKEVKKKTQKQPKTAKGADSAATPVKNDNVAQNSQFATPSTPAQFFCPSFAASPLGTSGSTVVNNFYIVATPEQIAALMQQ